MHLMNEIHRCVGMIKKLEANERSESRTSHCHAGSENNSIIPAIEPPSPDDIPYHRRQPRRLWRDGKIDARHILL